MMNRMNLRPIFGLAVLGCALFLAPSCATIVESKYQEVTLLGTEQVKNVKLTGSPSGMVTSDSSLVSLKRRPSGTIANITCKDGSKKTTTIPAKPLNLWFLLGNIPFFPIGHAIDLATGQAWQYENDVTIGHFCQ